MTIKKGQNEWSTKGNIVFTKWTTYNKVRRITPKFKYGTTPSGYKGKYYIEDRGNKEYAVIQEFSGYTSLREGYLPGRKEFVFRGTLRECKKWLVDLINKCYDGQGQLEMELNILSQDTKIQKVSGNLT